MSKNRERKESEVAALKERLSGAQATVLADFRGLTVAEDTELRAKLRTAGIDYKVVKNTILGFAAKDAGIDSLAPYLEGPTAIAFSDSDPVLAAKELAGFAKNHPNLELKAGILEGNVLDAQAVKALAALPSREVLLTNFVTGLSAPLTQLATVLVAPLRGFATAVDALRRERAGAEA